MIYSKCLRIAMMVLTTTLGLSACAALNESSAPFYKTTKLFSSTHCQLNKKTIKRIKDDKSLQAIIKNANSHHLNANPIDLSAVDFSSSNIYLVSMGLKPNSGYRLQMTDNKTILNNQTLTLPITIVLPEKGAMYAQVMTSPCTVISVQKGDYSSVNIKRWEAL